MVKMKKIKRKLNKIQSGYKILIWFLITIALFYTRLVNLGWGLPYPFHPDERNMAVAIQNLKCSLENQQFQISTFLKECYNPHFFAYGQFPLYLGYGGILLFKFLQGDLGSSITLQEAILSLRFISAMASLINFIVILKIIKIISPQWFTYLIASLLIIFSPFFIQFSHFGTTESFLMLFYSLIVFISLKLINLPKRHLQSNKFLTWLFFLALICGMAVATKVSSFIFLFFPLGVIFYRGRTFFQEQLSWQKKFVFNLSLFFILFPLFAIILSPHNLISWRDFLSSLKYESDVALGKYVAFYTRQFIGTVPIWFQLTKIFPYALGWPIFALAVLGFLLLSWRDQKINLLRLAFLVYFLPTAFLFAKWTRFMAPVFPLMILLATLFLQKLKSANFFKIIIVIISLIPGLAYLTISQNLDVRLVASRWIYQNIPENAYILSETANVVDLPLPHEIYESNKNYHYISFNFYDLEENPFLQKQLEYHLSKADYIIVPSRRIFANHPKERYPFIHQYYKRLFSGELGFRKIAEFDSYPKLNLQLLFFNWQLRFPDEAAEETWSVFDHPVVRVYKKL